LFFPLSFALVAWMQQRGWSASKVAAGLVLTGLVPLPSTRARLFFQLYQAPAAREYPEMGETPGWRRARGVHHRRRLNGAALPLHVMAVHSGLRYWHDRLLPGGHEERFQLAQDFAHHSPDYGKPCGLLIPIRSELPPIPPSLIARLSGKW